MQRCCAAVHIRRRLLGPLHATRGAPAHHAQYSLPRRARAPGCSLWQHGAWRGCRCLIRRRMLPWRSPGTGLCCCWTCPLRDRPSSCRASAGVVRCMHFPSSCKLR